MARAGMLSELQFLEEFAKHKDLISNEEDAIQYRTSSCYVNENDFDGEVTDWALHYLYSHQCPHSLAAAVARVTREELKLADLSECQLQENGETHTIPVLDANKLHGLVRRKVHEICDQWQNSPIFTPEKYKLWPVSTCSVKNSRRRMEDKHVLIPNLNIFFGLEDKSVQGYFAVFDGHAGAEAASYASVHLHHHIICHPSYNADIQTAVKEGFKKTDELFIEKCKRDNLKCGCTALCAIIQESDIHVAWVGDSQAFLVRKGAIKDIVAPHKPSREDERKRVEEQGGCVIHYGTWRVNGTLAISRAIGDSDFKPFVSSEPDIETIPRDGSEDFLIMACDGLWDVAKPDDAALTVYNCLNNSSNNIDDISEKLVQMAIQRGSLDNITIIVIFLRDPMEIAKDGVPESLKNIENTENLIPIHQESKLPEGVVTNGESPTKIPSNLWMSDAVRTTHEDDHLENLEISESNIERKNEKSEAVSEYFLLQTEDEKEKKFGLETTFSVTNIERSSQISLSTFDSTGAMATTSPTKGELKELEDLDLNVVVSHSNLSPSAPEFIPQGFVNLSQSEANEDKTSAFILDVKNNMEDDYASTTDDLITVDLIPDTIPVAEGVVDDDSEEGEDWQYRQVSKKSEDDEDIITLEAKVDETRNLESPVYEKVSEFVPKSPEQVPPPLSPLSQPILDFGQSNPLSPSAELSPEQLPDSIQIAEQILDIEQSATSPSEQVTARKSPFSDEILDNEQNYPPLSPISQSGQISTPKSPVSEQILDIEQNYPPLFPISQSGQISTPKSPVSEQILDVEQNYPPLFPISQSGQISTPKSPVSEQVLNIKQNLVTPLSPPAELSSISRSEQVSAPQSPFSEQILDIEQNYSVLQSTTSSSEQVTVPKSSLSDQISDTEHKYSPLTPPWDLSIITQSGQVPASKSPLSEQIFDIEHNYPPLSPVELPDFVQKSPVPQSPIAELKSPVPQSPIAEMKSPVPQSSIAELKSPVPQSPIAELKSPVPQSPIAELKSPVPQSPIAELKSPVPQSPIAELKSPVPQSRISEQNSPVPKLSLSADLPEFTLKSSSINSPISERACDTLVSERIVTDTHVISEDIILASSLLEDGTGSINLPLVVENSSDKSSIAVAKESSKIKNIFIAESSLSQTVAESSVVTSVVKEAISSVKTENKNKSTTKSFDSKVSATTKTMAKTRTQAVKPKLPLSNVKTSPVATTKTATTKLTQKDVGSKMATDKKMVSKTTTRPTTLTKDVVNSEKPFLKARSVTSSVKTAKVTTASSGTTGTTGTIGTTKAPLRKTSASSVSKATTTPTLTSTSRCTPTKTTTTTNTLKHTTNSTRGAASAITSRATSSTKDSKENVNKQILTTNKQKPPPSRTTLSRTTTLKSTSCPTTSRTTSTLKKGASSTTTTTTTTTASATNQKTGQRRPATAPPARPRTASGTKISKAAAVAIDDSEGHKKEKGTLDEKTKEQVLLPPSDGHGDEASVGVDSTVNEESANPNPHGSGDPAI